MPFYEGFKKKTAMQISQIICLVFAFFMISNAAVSLNEMDGVTLTWFLVFFLLALVGAFL